MVVGDNGLLSKAQSASKETAKADFKERANMILAEMSADELTGALTIAGENKEEKKASRLAVLATKMESEIEYRAPSGVEYQISSVAIGNGSESSPLLVPSDSNKGTKTITVTTSPKTGANYYAKIQGVYYPITLDTDLTLGVEEAVSTENNEAPAVEASAQNSKINVNAVQDTTNKAITTITLSGKGKNQNLGTDTLNIYMPGKSTSEDTTEKQTVSVKVGAIYTVKVEAELEEGSTSERKGTITSPSLKSGEVYAEEDYLEGSVITLGATPKANSDYELLGWYLGNSETPMEPTSTEANTYKLPVYDSNNFAVVNNAISLNITAKFGEPAPTWRFVSNGDKNGDSIVDAWDEVKYGREEFYVIKKDTSTTPAKLTLLAKKNLATAKSSGKWAQADGNNTCKFSSTNYWRAPVADLNTYTTEEVASTNLQTASNNAIMRAREYAGQFGEGVVGRLLLKSEAQSTSGDDAIFSGSTKLAARNATTFWLSSANIYDGENFRNVSGVNSEGTVYYSIYETTTRFRCSPSFRTLRPHKSIKLT